jgi:hypothetical protein
MNTTEIRGDSDPVLETESGRRDAGMVFLVGMVLAGALTVFATLAAADAPATPVTPQAQVSTH